jgi:hypothetical protein
MYSSIQHSYPTPDFFSYCKERKEDYTKVPQKLEYRSLSTQYKEKGTLTPNQRARLRQQCGDRCFTDDNIPICKKVVDDTEDCLYHCNALEHLLHSDRPNHPKIEKLWKRYCGPHRIYEEGPLQKLSNYTYILTEPPVGKDKNLIGGIKNIKNK